MFAKHLTALTITSVMLSGAALAQSTAPSTSTMPAPAASASSTMPSSTMPMLKGSWRASKLVGLNVYNEANEKLGDISEVLVDSSGKINAVIIGVGGFLGVGQRDIAVAFDKLKFVDEPVRASTASADRTPGMAPAPVTAPPATTTGAATTTTTSSSRDNWYPDHAVMSGTKDQLKAMPDFKYSDNR